MERAEEQYVGHFQREQRAEHEKGFKLLKG